jgi:Fic family protein
VTHEERASVILLANTRHATVMDAIEAGELTINDWCDALERELTHPTPVARILSLLSRRDLTRVRSGGLAIQKVLDALKDGPLTGVEVAARAGVPYASGRAYLSELTKSGVVAFEIPGGRGRSRHNPARYYLPAEQAAD